MSEREKMLSGLPYDSRNPELLEMYHHAKRLLKSYNKLDSRDTATRERLLRDLLGEVGPGVWIEAPFFCDYGTHLRIGAGTFVNVNCTFIDDNYITIGRNGLIGPGVHIYTASHPLAAHDRITTRADGSRHYRTQTAPVTIGNDVWIGGNTVICPGVTIGDRVTIGAGSVVTKDVPADVLALGSPCRVVRQIPRAGDPSPDWK